MASVLPKSAAELDVQEKKIYSFIETVKSMILTSPLNIFLICIPIAFISNYGLNNTPMLTFILLDITLVLDELHFILNRRIVDFMFSREK